MELSLTVHESESSIASLEIFLESLADAVSLRSRFTDVTCFARHESCY